MNYSPAIIIPAYNRPQALGRLLQSVNNAYYTTNNIQLTISLEGDATEDVRDCAKNFSFQHGQKNIVSHSEHLGLRNHIIWCGDQTNKFDSIVLLEDDLFVDKMFYKFAKEALEFYSSDNDIAGISLYAPNFNENASLPFEPIFNGESTYPMQVPCSWGQAWSKSQWDRFRSWYKSRTQFDIKNCLKLPEVVKNWPESSWKKYFATFMVEYGLYFIYPYQSLSTHCSDTDGTHNKKIKSKALEAKMASPSRKNGGRFEFTETQKSGVIYDSFFELDSSVVRRSVPEWSNKDMEIDLYCTKPIGVLQSKDYVITTRSVDNPLSKINLSFRPIDYNLLCPVGIDSCLQAVLISSSNVIDGDTKFVQDKLADFFNTTGRYKMYKKELNEIRNSVSWKITKPLRFSVDFIKSFTTRE